MGQEISPSAVGSNLSRSTFTYTWTIAASDF